MKKRFTTILSAIALCSMAAVASETVPADTNGDGKVDKADATLIYSYILGTAGTAVTAVTTTQVDVNGDGKVDTADVVEVYNYIIKVIGDIDVNASDWITGNGGSLETE